jgi:AAA domain (dynein-related subfamily)
MEVRMTTEVSLAEAEDAILAFGNENAIHLVGEPGVGKTAMFERIVAKTGFRGVYIDTPNTELGDIGIPMPNHDTKTTTLYPNEHWGFHLGDPCVIFIDEFTKPSSMAVQNMLHPLLNERRISGSKLHTDSIVITAGNNSTDGVGDLLKSHSINRITILPVRKPTANEWIEWGALNGIAAEALAWVKAYPHALASYRDGGQAENPYIFNPKTPQKSFVSPRSLHRASNILLKRHMVTRNALIAGLTGSIGEAGARDMLAYVEVADSLPTWAEVIDDPKGCKLPTSPAALNIMAYGAMQRIDRSNISKWFEYLKRTPKELQSVFCLSTAKHPEKKQVLMTSGAFVEWMRANQYLF